MAIGLRPHKHSAKTTASRLRRQIRVRKKINGTADRPRLVVSKSSKHLFAQVIDDVAGKTLVSASTMEADLRGAEQGRLMREHGYASSTPVTDGENGFLVPVEDDAVAADRLLMLLRDPERAARIGENGRNSVQTRFSAEAMIQKLIGVYRDLLAERDGKQN